MSLAVATSTPTPAKNSTDLQVLESRGGSLPSWARGPARALGLPGEGLGAWGNPGPTNASFSHL